MHHLDSCPFTRRRFLVTAGLGMTAAAASGAASPSRQAARVPRSKVVRQGAGQKTYLLVFDKGAEVLSGLLQFASKYRLVGGSLSGIGAVSDAEVAFFDRQKKEYRPILVAQQAEVLALTGNLALRDEQPFFHVHAVLGLPDGSTRGGHLVSAHVWPTLEVVLTTWATPARRKLDRETGLPLLAP
jgi:predicted DNA-binding protein with PD1-like motif